MKKADDEQQSAFARAASGQDVDPRCIPIELNEEPPVGMAISTPKYTEVEQATWRQLCERQNALLPGRACQEFHEGQERLQLSASANSIPARPLCSSARGEWLAGSAYTRDSCMRRTFFVCSPALPFPLLITFARRKNWTIRRHRICFTTYMGTCL
jgi:hypothetical protein